MSVEAIELGVKSPHEKFFSHIILAIEAMNGELEI